MNNFFSINSKSTSGRPYQPLFTSTYSLSGNSQYNVNKDNKYIPVNKSVFNSSTEWKKK